MEKAGYIENGYPNKKGVLCSMLRAENELFLSEIILSGIFDELEVFELASAVCALVTEDIRTDIYPDSPISRNTRKALNRIKEIRRKISALQKEADIDTEMYLNSYYCPLIEQWVQGAPWEDIAAQAESSGGDIVRVFKRTADVLRQLAILPDINENLKTKSREAVNSILKEPVDAD